LSGGSESLGIAKIDQGTVISTFNYDTRQGIVLMILKDGSKYFGEWKNFLMHGYGT
jgi:hypothetical protein